MTKFVTAAAVGLLLLAAGLFSLKAQDPAEFQLPVSDPICTFFGPNHDQFVAALYENYFAGRQTEEVSAKVAPALQVMAALATAGIPSAPGGSRTDAIQNPAAGGIIDRYIFEKIAQAGIAVAPPTTDIEFLRRVTLDLTGRIPTANAVQAFAADPAVDKRARLVDQLLAQSAWVDKWTMWLGDLLENNSFNSLGANRYPTGVNAFNIYIRASLTNGKPYDQMVREMIAATGADSYTQGELNFLTGGVMGGGPIQDVFDKETANIAEKFLGIAHLDCLLCHNGRTHLDALSLWGYGATRNEAYGMASFLSHTANIRTGVDGTPGGNPYYWSLLNDSVQRGVNYTIDYRLNTTTGNRPVRGATNSTVTVSPVYMFTGERPRSGEPYRAALARMLTADRQFARATVNYVWEYYFGIGLVNPSNQFDPARLDPDNPPKDCPIEANPCALQASHPRLLNELAQKFIAGGYNLKSLMREIVNSRAYQLSSRYSGTWNPTDERLFARKLVRRLWAEEIHDAIVQSYGVPVTYNNAIWGPVQYAMQLPEPLNTPGGATTTFLDAFLRGNRDDNPRKGDGSIAQALGLMNDTFVYSRVVNTAATTLLGRSLPLPDDQLVNVLYLNVLSRYPTADELAAATANLRAPNIRITEAQNLLWSLYNKVDFIFNY